MPKRRWEYAEHVYHFARTTERKAIEAFEKEEESIANKFGSGKKGCGKEKQTGRAKAREKQQAAEQVIQQTESARPLQFGPVFWLSGSPRR